MFRNAHYKYVNTKHSGFVQTSPDTTIKVTVLPLTYVAHDLMIFNVHGCRNGRRFLTVITFWILSSWSPFPDIDSHCKSIKDCVLLIPKIQLLSPLYLSHYFADHSRPTSIFILGTELAILGLNNLVTKREWESLVWIIFTGPELAVQCQWNYV